MDRVDLAHQCIPMFTMFLYQCIPVYHVSHQWFLAHQWYTNVHFNLSGDRARNRLGNAANDSMTTPCACRVHVRFGSWQACTKQLRGFAQKKIQLVCVVFLFLDNPTLCIQVEFSHSYPCRQKRRQWQDCSSIELWLPRGGVSARLHFGKHIWIALDCLNLRWEFSRNAHPQLHSCEPCDMFNDQELHNYIYLVLIIISYSQH